MEQNKLTLGSLFDGSGGFPLGGILAGIEPKWSSEIEPFCIRVTTKRLPQVKHLGDISQINGADIEPVAIITFGSPCQDLSIAGKRAGIHDGNRSNLFFQAIRIIKEMRDATNGKYPRYCVWENVFGCFSSNGGNDFKSVLEAVIGVKEEGIEVPSPENHRWSKADVYLGDGWSVAYRVFDAQYWGVAQRRKRIYLVADFAGGSAPQILFKSEGLSGYTPQSFRSWQGAAGGAEESSGTAGRRSDAGSGVLCVNTQGNSGIGITEDKSLALVSQDHGNHPAVLHAAGFSTEHSAKARSIGYEEEVSPTLRAGVVPAALSVENYPTDGRIKIRDDEKCQTLTSRAGTGGNNVPLVAEPRIKAYGVCSKHSNSMMSDNPHSGFYEATTSRTLDQSGGNSVTSNQGGICVVAPAPETYDVRFTSDGTKNARGHCYPTEISRCLDTSETTPDSNQGDVCVVALEPGAASRVGGHIYSDGKSGALRANAGDNQQAVMMPETYSLQGSMIGRSDKNGPQGDGINEDVCFTLNTIDRHAIAAPESDHYSTSKNSHHTVAAHEQANTLVASDWKDPPLVNDTPNQEPTYIVRRLTPVECARLQGFPSEYDLSADSTRDEVAAVAIASGFISVDFNTGRVLGHRGPGGTMRSTPVELQGSIVNGYKVYSIHAGGVKKQIRANRLIWIAAHGLIPDGMVVDHINNDKLDNRLCNLQILSPEDNSHKAHADGLYPTGDDCPSSKITEQQRVYLSHLYWKTNLTLKELALRFGISESRAQQIIHEYEWCADLAIPDPTDEDIAFWTEVWETWRSVTNPNGKPKTEKQIRKWLADPYTDSAEYKLWGNGVSLPIVFFVLSGIVWAYNKDLSQKMSQ